jgi:hypothetical protein
MKMRRMYVMGSALTLKRSNQVALKWRSIGWAAVALVEDSDFQYVMNSQSANLLSSLSHHFDNGKFEGLEN